MRHLVFTRRLAVAEEMRPPMAVGGSVAPCELMAEEPGTEVAPKAPEEETHAAVSEVAPVAPVPVVLPRGQGSSSSRLPAPPARQSALPVERDLKRARTI